MIWYICVLIYNFINILQKISNFFKIIPQINSYYPVYCFMNILWNYIINYWICIKMMEIKQSLFLIYFWNAMDTTTVYFSFK